MQELVDLAGGHPAYLLLSARKGHDGNESHGRDKDPTEGYNTGIIHRRLLSESRSVLESCDLGIWPREGFMPKK